MEIEVEDVKSFIDTLWVIDCAILVFIMQAGFMCVESGLSRHKNSINVALKNAADFGVSVVVFWLFQLCPKLYYTCYALAYDVSRGT